MDLLREYHFVLRRDQRALAFDQDGLRAEFGDRHHRRALRHRFDQDQTLGFGLGGKHEDVGSLVAGIQFGVAVQIADKQDVLLQVELRGQLVQALFRRPLAGDDEQHLRLHCPQLHRHAQKEIDVLLESDPTDVERDRPVRRNPEFLAECAAIGICEALRLQAGRNHLGPDFDAIVAQHIKHGFRRCDDGIDAVALATRNEAGDTACHAARDPRQVMVQIILKEGVIGLDAGNVEQVRQFLAEIMGDERRMDMHQVVLFATQLHQLIESEAVLHQPVFRVEIDAA